MYNNAIVEVFNILPSTTDRSSRQKTNKEMQDLNHALNQMLLIDIYRILHPTAAENTFFSSKHETFSRTDHMIIHKISLSKFKKTEIIPNIFSDHNMKTRNQ